MAPTVSLEKITLEQLEANYSKALVIAAEYKPQKTLMTKQWTNIMFERILSAKNIALNDGYETLHSAVKDALDKYDVVIEGTRKKLLLKSELPGFSKEIIPFEESFSKVWEAHESTNHGGINAMKDWLAHRNIEMSDVCLSVLIKVCNNCQALINRLITEIPKEKKYKLAGLITIVDMSLYDSADKTFDCLLIYQDRDTKFVQMRPFSTFHLVDTISFELMQMFADLGPPDCIIVPPALKNMFDDIIDKKLNIFFHTKIAMDTCEDSTCKLNIEVRSSIHNWIQSNPKSKWCIDCFLIQMQMNNVSAEGCQSSYEKIFSVNNPHKIEENKDTSLPVNELADVVSKMKVEPTEHIIDEFIENNSALELSGDSE